MKKIFVIIVTYKGKHWYDKCFSSLRESMIPLQTVAVDNTPGEEDAEYIKAQYPEVHIIKPEGNLGFGRANNLGMRYALDNGCDYVFLLNQDTWVDKDAIEKVVAISEKHPEYGIVSPMHMNADKSGLCMGLGLRQDNFKLLSDLYVNKVADIYETNYVNAAAWLLPRKTLETVGGFDPIFKHYEEDDNYLNRVQYHGQKIGVCPSAQIVHDHKDSPLTDERLEIRQQQFQLVEWTNINQPYSVGRVARLNIRKWLSNVIGGKWSRAKVYRRRLAYCYQMRKDILKSRKENVQKKASWL